MGRRRAFSSFAARNVPDGLTVLAPTDKSFHDKDAELRVAVRRVCIPCLRRSRENRGLETLNLITLAGEDKTISMTSDKETTTADWRELARRIQREEDPEKVLTLVQELIAKFNEEKLRKNLRLDEK